MTTRASEANVVAYCLDSGDAGWLRNHAVYGVNGSETKRIGTTVMPIGTENRTTHYDKSDFSNRTKTVDIRFGTMLF